MTIWMLVNDSENGMACSCCAMDTAERVMGLFATKELAISELKNIAEQVTGEDTIRWDMDTSFEVVTEKEHVLHSYTIYSMEVQQ